MYNLKMMRWKLRPLNKRNFDFLTHAHAILLGSHVKFAIAKLEENDNEKYWNQCIVEKNVELKS